MEPRPTPPPDNSEPIIYACPHATCVSDCWPRKLRAAGNRQPLLVIAARGLNWPGCLNAGADVYLDSSFLRPLMRQCSRASPTRDSQPSVPDPWLQVGDLRLNLITCIAYRGGKEIELTLHEYRLLALLMSHEGELCSRTYLLEQVWGTPHEPGSTVVETHMCRLREKIDDGFEIKLIHNKYGKGYVLREE